MKKAMYILLLALEVFVDLIALGLIYSWAGLLGMLLCAAVCIGAVVFFNRRRKTQAKEGDAEAAKKSKRRMILALLIPAVAAFAVIVYTFIGLAMYI